MKAKIIQVVGTEKYPYACVIDVDDTWVTDRICNEDKAKKLVQYIETCPDIKALRLKLAMACIELKMSR